MRQITNADFVTGVRNEKRGITLCGRQSCKICKLYLQECDSFETANGVIWEIRCQINCNSKNVVYYLLCNFCLHESNIGKTDDLRLRVNNHISCCRHGTGTDLFDLHVHECAKKHSVTTTNENQKSLSEPYFKLYVFMAISNYAALRNHERRLHLLGYDTINNPNSANASTNTTTR